MHKKGLHFGLSASAGSKMCHSGGPGTLGRETTDVADFVDWGVHYLKYDGCGDNGGHTDIDRFTVMANALAEQYGHKIMYAINNEGEEAVASWARNIANSWTVSKGI